MITARALLRRDGETSDDATLADTLIAEARTKDDLADVVRGLLVDEFRRIRRQGMRTEEQRLERTLTGRTPIPPAVDEPDADPLDATFVIITPGDPPTRTITTWATASVDEHRARMGMLQSQIAGLGATISRHRKAIALCEDHGVDRLADVPRWPELLSDAA